MNFHVTYPRFLLIIVLFLSVKFSSAQNVSELSGAWQLNKDSGEEVLLFQDGYFTHTTYRSENGEFVSTRGGTFNEGKGQVSVDVEFNSTDKDEVNLKRDYKWAVKGDRLTININGKPEEWKRLDKGKAPLAGVWRITDRMEDGKIVPIHQTGTRKTLKILTGERFQWVAIDPGTKSFSGTGGGKYTFKDGKYTEHIEFFSRDNDRVGAKLTFDGKLEAGKWHHSGLSSKGDKIYEVWGRVK